MKPLDKILDHLALLEQGDKFEHPSNTKNRTKDLAEEWDESYIDLYVLADSLKQIGETLISETRDSAYAEASLKGHEEKFEHRGIHLTPFEGYAKYDYPNDDILDKYAKQLEVVEEKMEPFKKERKAIKDSIKSRKTKLQKQGKAKLKSKTRGLRVDRK